MNGKIRTWMLALACLTAAHALSAQKVLQVASRTIEKTFPYQQGAELNIEGEKAEIRVSTWERDEVKIKLEIFSRHPEKHEAARSLEAMRWKVDQHANKIYFRNYIDEKLNPSAALKAVYTVLLPADCPVYLKNHFGMTDVRELSRSLRINSEFSKTWLRQLQGDIQVVSSYGDVEGDGLSGNVFIQANRGDISLHRLQGRVDIVSKYGVVKLFTAPTDPLLSLNITADRSDVYFFDPQPGLYGYTLTAHYGNITAPADLRFNFVENSRSLKRAVFNPGKETGTISIKITFGDIVIRNP